MTTLKAVALSLALMFVLVAVASAAPSALAGPADQQEPPPRTLLDYEPDGSAAELQALPASPEAELACPEWQAPPSTSYRAFPDAGLYGFLDWKHLDPDVYPWIKGGHSVTPWRFMEYDGPGQYRWEQVDQWIAAEAALGKQVGLAFNTYEGWCCGGNQVPRWYNEAHGAWPAGDGYVTCSWSDNNGLHQEDIPMYWTESYLASFESFIAAAAARYRDDPRVSFVEVSTGIYGETTPAETDDEVKSCLAAAGLDTDRWVETVNRIVDIYQRHWHDTPLLLQYAPWYQYRLERRLITDYAGGQGVGLKHNRLLWDGDDMVIRSDNGTIHPDVCRTGQTDPMLQWAGQVPMGWEGESVYYANAGDFLWSILNGMNKHASYLLIGKQSLQSNDPTVQWALRLADRYAGVTVDTTPGVWTALRETSSLWFPQRGNYDFWLRQDNNAPGGRTIPQWNVTSYPWGKYTRRTDTASGNTLMAFDVDNAYLFDNPAAAPAPVTITVIYLDDGTDTWDLQYDAIGDPAKVAGVVQKTGTGRWLEATFALPDARFAGQLAGYDFRIRARDSGNEFVSFVEVVKGGRGRSGEWRVEGGGWRAGSGERRAGTADATLTDQ